MDKDAVSRDRRGRVVPVPVPDDSVVAAATALLAAHPAGTQALVALLDG